MKGAYKMKQVFQMMMGFLLTLVSYLFGKIDMALYALLVVIGIDCISGLAKSYIIGNINSKIGMKGCIKKVSYLFVVSVAVIIDRLCNSGGVIRLFIIYYIVINECISILENCAEMKLPIPKILMEKLEKLKEENNTSIQP